MVVEANVSNMKNSVQMEILNFTVVRNVKRYLERGLLNTISFTGHRLQRKLIGGISNGKETIRTVQD